MTGEFVPKRVFEVARELKIPTPEILEYLGGLGHDVSRKQMQPVSEPMYIALLHKFDRNRLEQYLIGHGIVGEELRRFMAFLDEQRRKAVKPIPVVAKPAPARPRAPRPPLKPQIVVTFYRRERRPQPAVPTPQPPPLAGRMLPVDPMMTVSATPQAIPTTPLALELIQRTLALPYDQKLELLESLRRNAAA